MKCGSQSLPKQQNQTFLENRGRNEQVAVKEPKLCETQASLQSKFYSSRRTSAFVNPLVQDKRILVSDGRTSRGFLLCDIVVGRWSILIESWSKSSSDATIDFAFFIIDCRRKIKNLLGTNKSSIKINKNVRLISCVSCLFSWTPNF